MEYDDEVGEPRDDIIHGQKLRAAIDFGLQIQQFLDGEIGQRLQADAEARRLKLMEALVNCKEEDIAVAREIRQSIGILDHWQYFFASYIEEGKKAEVEFQEE